jgi:uncharacterized protein YaiE (UPF0345 family)
MSAPNASEPQTSFPLIKHNTYPSGKVESLEFRDAAGNRHSIGVMLPGDHDFGIAEYQEEITVTFGELIVNGHSFIEGETVTLVPGDKIRILVKNATTYRCDYR